MGATWTFHSAGQIIFGPGAVTQLGEVATRLGLRQIHLISDPILDRAGIVAQVREPLRQAGVEVLVDLGGEPEPTLAAALHCLERWQPGPDEGQFVNVGTGTDVTIRELAEQVAQAVGYGGRIEWDASKPDGTPRKLLDVGRLASLGWTSRISLEDGLRSTVEEFIQQRQEGAEVRL